MTIDNKKFLLILIIINIIAVPVVIFTTGPGRIILGIILVVFLPGYALTSAIFPKKNDIDAIERLALSFGLSIAIVPLIGLILNYTPYGIKLYPVTITISTFVIVTSAIGYLRQQKLPPDERFHVTIKNNLFTSPSTGKLDKALSACLLITIVTALGCLAYTLAQPKQGERYTEFYIVGTAGKAEGYPQQIALGESANIVIGIINHENQIANYRVIIKVDGVENTEINMGALNSEEKLERQISFTPKAIGKRQKIEFQLYLNNESKPYFDDPLHLYIDVTTPLGTGMVNSTIKLTYGTSHNKFLFSNNT